MCVCLCVHLSVHLSVCHMMALSQNDAHKLGSQNLHRIAQELVLVTKVLPEIRKGSPQARVLNESGVGKIHNFQPVSRHISEMVEDRTKVSIN